MQRAERLLNLAALLLRASEPVSWREIREQFAEDYGGRDEAAIRKFERDKAELLELGIPIRWAVPDEEGPAGYIIDKDELYLPNLELPPEDLALLYLAGSVALAQGAFPYGKDLAHAMNKLAFAARAPGASEAAGLAALHLSREAGEGGSGGAGESPVARKLEELSQAIAARKKVHLSYEGAERGARTERDVDPYGLYQSGGAWFLVGHCHLRRALRTFHLGRVTELLVNASAPRTPDFTEPEGFDLRAQATQQHWELDLHPPLRCAVRLESPVSPEARASFGPRAELHDLPRDAESGEGGGTLVELTVTHADALVRHVLSLGDRAEILSPAPVRERARRILAGLAERCALP